MGGSTSIWVFEGRISGRHTAVSIINDQTHLARTSWFVDANRYCLAPFIGYTPVSKREHELGGMEDVLHAWLLDYKRYAYGAVILVEGAYRPPMAPYLKRPMPLVNGPSAKCQQSAVVLVIITTRPGQYYCLLMPVLELSWNLEAAKSLECPNFPYTDRA